MHADERELINNLIEKVIGAVYEVSNVLGAGFLEKVYERALVKELTLRGLHAEVQYPIQVAYKGETVGDYYADILVERKLIVELKCAERLGNDHLAQCLNYLKATGHSIALLVNFQHPKVEWKRVVNNF
ncbi:MAG: GxxExxY protein [Deltaproteobacteria bacterium]|nr:GxxExxY protein [Deltaproteobacteria bacterium]